MIRFCIALFLLAVFRINAHAQNIPIDSIIISDNSINSYSQVDTIKAVANLFDRRRSGGWFTIRSGTKVGAGAAVAILIGGSSPVGFILMGIPMGIGIGKLIRFSSKKESAIISTYQQANHLPVSIRRKLKKKHFK